MNMSQLKQQYDAAKSRRALWEDLWEEIYDLMLPMNEGFFTDANAEEGMDNIYDETAIVAIQQFASRLQYNLMPNFSTWFRLEPGMDMDPRENKRTQAALDEVTKYIAGVLANSNISQATHEAFLDLAVGTGNMLVQKGTLEKLIDFDAVCQPEVFLLPGPHGTIDRIFRKRKLANKAHAKQLWPKGNFSDSDKRQMQAGGNDKECHVIEYIYRNWQNEGTEEWQYCVWFDGGDYKIHEDTFKGQHSCPWLNFRWSQRPSEVYGRGPAVLALPAARVANLVTKLTMENADLQIGGMWQADDDGTINTDTIELVSGTIIPVAPGSRGLQSIAPGGRIDFGDLLLSRNQEHIRDVFFNENLGSLDKTPMSATEATIRQGRLAEVMGSSFGRLHYEFLTPLIGRIIYLLKEQNLIEIPKIDGREVAVKSVSPLARGLKQERVGNMTNFYGTVMQLLGPQKGQVFVKDDEFVKELASNFEIPATMLTDENDRKKMGQQMGQVMAEADDAAPGAGAEIAKLATGGGM